jgi:4-hydroxy-tetrahydrodipicolinate reductase
MSAGSGQPGLRVAVFGASGRMGRSIVGLLAREPGMRLAGAVAARGDPALGQDAGLLAGVDAADVTVSADSDAALARANVAIDFTLPDASLAHARACGERGVPIVIGTTGHDAAGLDELRRVGDSIAVVHAPNMSLGVNLLFKLAELAAQVLDEGYDAEIFEAHHRNKVDAPSGTALRLGVAVAQGRDRSLEQAGVFSRSGVTGPREPGTIGFSVMRGGDIVGEHRLVFAGPGEQVELRHLAQDRSGFARGALRAARWVVARPPGLYSMLDVLGL